MTQASPNATLKALDSALDTLVLSLGPNEPCGQDPRLEPIFSDLREQTTAQARPNASPTDWRWVESSATTLLENNTQDLRVGAFLAAAYIHRQGLAGLSKGLRLLYLLLKRHALALHPHARNARETAKIRALEWYLQHTRQHLGTTAQNSATKLDVEFAIARLDDLNETCKALFKTHPTEFDSLRSALLALPTASSPPTAPSQTPLSDIEQGRVAEHKDATSTPAPNKATPWLDALGVLRAQAHLTREANPTQPLSYRLLRAALWTPIEAAPLRESEQGTQIPLPTEHERNQLQAHVAAQQWRGLLEHSENLFCRYVLALDLQRFTLMALQELGDAQDAIASVRGQLVALVTRIPELLRLHGANGQPLASAQTRLWIEQELLDNGAPHPPSTTDETDDALASQSWWRAVTDIPTEDHNARLEQLQFGLEQAPDRLTYARRALFAARQLPQIEGLGPLLASLAQKRLRESGEHPVCNATERACWALLASTPAHAPSTDPLLELAQVHLSAALPRFILRMQGAG